MKVYKDGKEVKDAKVIYHSNGSPFTVKTEGTNYDASAFEFKEEKSVKKTKESNKKSQLMTTEDIK